MKKYIVDVYRTDALLKVVVMALNEKEATNHVLDMLMTGDGVYPDIPEADFIESDAEYLIMGDYANRYTTKVNPGLVGYIVKKAKFNIFKSIKDKVINLF